MEMENKQKVAYESFTALIWRRFRKSKPGIVGFFLVVSLIVLSAFSEFFCPNNYYESRLGETSSPPHRIRLIDADGNFHLQPFFYPYASSIDFESGLFIWEEDTSRIHYINFFTRGWSYRLFGLIPLDLHLFTADDTPLYILGTDKIGRDIFGRAMYSGRISLAIGLLSVLLSMTFGSVIGVASGFYGGMIDNILQRVIEFLRSFPQLPLWMALTMIIPPEFPPLSIFIVMSIIFAVLGWTTVAREIRGKTMALRELDYVMAAREMGAGDLRIIFVHLLPNTLSHLIVVMTMTIPTIILGEAFLSFLGIGIQEPLSSWGFMMKNARSIEVLGSTIWILSPGIFIVLAVLGFNFLGDGLRDAADPYSVI